MELENLEQISSFGIAAAKYMSVLYVVLWLCSAMFELVERQPSKKQIFYKGVFWIIYMVSALACGLFLKIISIDESKKTTILMVLMIIALVVANRVCRYFEITARKAAVVFQYFWTRIKKNGRF